MMLFFDIETIWVKTPVDVNRSTFYYNSGLPYYTKIFGMSSGGLGNLFSPTNPTR